MPPSPGLEQALNSSRTEAEARRNLLEASLLAEGMAPDAAKNLASIEVARRMLDHERHLFGAISDLMRGSSK